MTCCSHDPNLRSRSSLIGLGLTSGILLLALGLRVWGCMDDFWFDEIWSWDLVRSNVHSFWDVLFKLKHDNNHFLNSWWIYLLGPEVDWRWYRLPAVIFGVGTILLLRRAALEFNSVAVNLVTVFTVPAYLLIQYSSEARGYAAMLFFAIAAYLLLNQLLPSATPATNEVAPNPLRHRIQIAFFGLCCFVGCLGHPSFILVFLSLGLWAFCRVMRLSVSWLKRFFILLKLFIFPMLGIAALWKVNISQLQYGGGPWGDLWHVGAATLSLMVGGPAEGHGALAVGILVALVVLAEICLLARKQDDRCVLCVALIAAPLLAFLLTGRHEVYPRYFLGSVIFLYLMLANFTARIAQKNRTGRWAVIVLCCLIVLGNALHLKRFYEQGRGHALSVLQWIETNTQGPDCVIGGDHLFRHGMVFKYYAPRISEHKKIIYLSTGPWPGEGPEWVVTHSLNNIWQPQSVYIDYAGRRYQLMKIFHYAGLSGWHTAIYHNLSNKPIAGVPASLSLNHQSAVMAHD